MMYKRDNFGDYSKTYLYYTSRRATAIANPDELKVERQQQDKRKKSKENARLACFELRILWESSSGGDELLFFLHPATGGSRSVQV